MILTALAHGVLGGWDEALVYGLLVVVIAVVLMLRRTERKPAEQEGQKPADEGKQSLGDQQ